MNATISVIVPVYNVEKYLNRCVDSILMQTYRNMEIILVDDGATDSSGVICDEYAQKDSRIRVIHKENGGLSDARNAGIEAAKGQYFCFIDSDDYIDPEMLEVLYHLITDNEADISVCGIRDCFDSGKCFQSSENKQFVILGKEALRYILEGKYLYGSICNKLICRELCQDHRFVKGKTYEDAFFIPELFLRAKKVAATTKSYYNYWHRSDSITTKPFSQKNMDVVEAYEYTYQVVQRCCPELIDVAMFRLYWAHFVVLDKMLVAENYKELPQFKPVWRFLKKNWAKIIRCKYFQSTRRVASIALRIHLKLYRALAIGQAHRRKVND